MRVNRVAYWVILAIAALSFLVGGFALIFWPMIEVKEDKEMAKTIVMLHLNGFACLCLAWVLEWMELPKGEP